MTGKHLTQMANIYTTYLFLYVVGIVAGFLIGGAGIHVMTDENGMYASWDFLGGVIGAVAAAVSALPMLLVFLAFKVVVDQRELQHGDTLWRLDQQTAALTEALAALQPASAEGSGDAIAADEEGTAGTLLGRTDSLVDTLLADPEIAAQARDIRKLYGKGVCASFLTRKAVERGLEGEPVTESDIPDTF
ncbi:hypothetical protein [Demequina sp. NBRC 110054]|uniref:hypothetical protein n=1 Tax=Demequina sp. NBRC 110054 TaxID=1570343 RepID=UPI0011779E20|nr:hypothetical protein [Demequina sp. NBRC 110054]